MPSPSVRLLSLTALLLAACSHNDSTPPTTTHPPAIVSAATVAANGNAWVPQAAVLSLGTDVPTRVELHLNDGQRSWDVIADPTYRTQHARVPVAGLVAGREHSIEVLVRDQNGNATTAPAPLHFTPPALPSWFPPIDVRSSNPQAMEPGVTLLALMTDAPGCLPCIVDEAGNVLWYLNCALTPLGQEQVMAFPLSNGHLMLVEAHLMVEVDLLGDVLQMFRAARLGGNPVPGAVDIDTDSFHHDIVELPAGGDADYAVLGTELRVLPNYPSSVVDPLQTTPTANVIGDEIVEFTRTGTVVRRVRLLDILDPYRVSYDSLGNFWDRHYGMATRDWSHANALGYDAAADSWLLSTRHQDAVFHIGRHSGQLQWIMGDPARWNAPWNGLLLTPIGSGFAWQYHQHAPQLQADGSFYVFDNGCGRAIPPAPQLPFAASYSRAVHFRVDGVARTVEQLWAYGGPPTGTPSFYSFFVSSAYKQPQTGNVLVCDGGKRTTAGRLYAHVFEITADAAPSTVFEFYVQADGVANTASYFIYRAWRLPAVYR